MQDEGRAGEGGGGTTAPPGGPPPGQPRRGRPLAGAGRAAAASARGARRAASYTYRQARRASHAEGAGESGLSRVIELHAFNAAGDAALAVGLAGTLFFQVPTEQARGAVFQFLLLTMLPFAVVAPLVGPFLDRFSHGRRWAIGGTMALRAFLAWVLADAISRESVALFPAALGCLVASKAYGVTRAAAVPRVAPPRLGLVRSNSRISLAGLVGAAVSAPIAVGVSLLGSGWTLRYAFLVYIGGTVLAVLLPRDVDDTAGEERERLTRRPRLPAEVVRALRCNAGLRFLSGFLTLFMAFLLRDQPFPGWEGREQLLLGLVIGSAGLGNSLGIGAGAVLRRVNPTAVVVVALLADTAVAVVAATAYALVTAVALGLTAGLAQSLGKLSLDSLIQQRVDERRRSSTFARSETLLQLSWVVGGLIGITLPLQPRLGLGVAALVLAAASLWVVSSGRKSRPGQGG